MPCTAALHLHRCPAPAPTDCPVPPCPATYTANPPPQVDKLRSEYQVDLRVLGVASSTQMLLNDQAMDLSAWRQDFADKVRGQARMETLGVVVHYLV